MIVGAVETANGRFNVTTKTAGVVATSKDAIQFIRNNDEQAKAQAEIDHFRNPRLVDLWVGNLDLGFAASRGNANTETLTLSTNAAARHHSRQDRRLLHVHLFIQRFLGRNHADHRELQARRRCLQLEPE